MRAQAAGVSLLLQSLFALVQPENLYQSSEAKPDGQYSSLRQLAGMLPSTKSQAGVRDHPKDPDSPGLDLWNVVLDGRTKKVRVFMPSKDSIDAIRCGIHLFCLKFPVTYHM